MRTKREIENEIINLRNLAKDSELRGVLNTRALRAIKHTLIWVLDEKTDHAEPSECGHILSQ